MDASVCEVDDGGGAGVSTSVVVDAGGNAAGGMTMDTLVIAGEVDNGGGAAVCRRCCRCGRGGAAPAARSVVAVRPWCAATLCIRIVVAGGVAAVYVFRRAFVLSRQLHPLSLHSFGRVAYEARRAAARLP